MTVIRTDNLRDIQVTVARVAVSGIKDLDEENAANYAV